MQFEQAKQTAFTAERAKESSLDFGTEGKKTYNNLSNKIGRSTNKSQLSCVSDSRYSGAFLRHGKGTYRHRNGSVYSGNWEFDKKCGHGKLTFADGSVYEGEWKDNLYQGSGRLSHPSGEVFEGKFVAGLKHGFGILSLADGTTIKGNWHQNNLEADSS